MNGKFRFWRAVRHEARVTWGWRFRPLWAGSGVGLLLWMAATREFDWSGTLAAPFVTLCALACWVPAWLCADLLSIRFRDNAEPHREWRPVEFLARAVGRLGPFYLALAVLAGMYCGRVLYFDLSLGTQSGWGPPEIERAEQFPGWWASWVAVFLSSSLPYAAGAALASACFRRPHRLLITPLVVVLLSLALLAAIAREPIDLFSLFSEKDAVPWLVLMPNYTIGFGFVVALQRLSPDLLEGLSASVGAFPAICLWASGFFVLCSAPLFLATWRIAAKRYRRHPYTATPSGAAAFERAGKDAEVAAHGPLPSGDVVVDG